MGTAFWTSLAFCAGIVVGVLHTLFLVCPNPGPSTVSLEEMMSYEPQVAE